MDLPPAVTPEEPNANPLSVFGSRLNNHELEEDTVWPPRKKTKKIKKSVRWNLEAPPIDAPLGAPLDAPLESDKLPAKSWPAVFHSILAAPILVSGISSPYSEYLTSRMVAVVVSSGKTYHLHSSLLCRESERFHNSLTSEHAEATQLKIDLIDESDEQFSQFVHFLYDQNWAPSDASSIQLAELYALGERLVARKFQDVIIRKFREGVQHLTLSPAQLCQLSSIACGKITERFHPRDDPMRDVIFWLVSRQISQIQKTEEFRQVLMEHGELGTQLVLRAGNGTEQMPEDPIIVRENDAMQPVKMKKKGKRSVLNTLDGWGN